MYVYRRRYAGDLDWQETAIKGGKQYVLECTNVPIDLPTAFPAVASATHQMMYSDARRQAGS